MSNVDIKNLTKKTVIIRLPHQVFCVKVGKCYCNGNGTSANIHIPGNGVVQNQSKVVLETEDAKVLLKGKPRIKVSDTKVEKSKKPKAAEPPQTQNRGRKGKKK